MPGLGLWFFLFFGFVFPGLFFFSLLGSLGLLTGETWRRVQGRAEKMASLLRGKAEGAGTV